MANSISLGDVLLAVGEPVEWPLVRGYAPSVVSFTQPITAMDRLQAVPFETTLNFDRDGQVVSIPVLKTEVGPETWKTCRVVLSDARYLYARGFWPLDINVRLLDEHQPSGDGTVPTVKQPQYLVGTSYAQGTSSSVADTASSIYHAIYSGRASILRSFGFEPYASSAVDMLPPEATTTPAPDNELLAGLSISEALRALLDPIGVDLVNAADGSITFATRDADELPPELSKARFIQPPPWESGETKRTGIPATVKTPYAKRIALVADNELTRAQTNPPTPYLEQVYEGISDSGFVTLPELIASQSAAMGARSAEISEEIIREEVFGRTRWQGTILQLFDYSGDFGLTGLTPTGRTVRAKAIVSRIERDWRRLFRIKLPQGQVGGGDPDLPQYGIYTDIVFGRLRDAATVDALDRPEGGDAQTEPESLGDAAWIDPARAVTTEWVDLYAKWIDGPGGDALDRAYNALGAKNNPRDTTGLSPFVPVWEDKARGVFRLEERVGPNITNRIPGRLEDEHFYERFDSNKFVELLRRDPQRMIRSRVFTGTPTISVEIVATIRHPQDLTRWHVVENSVPDSDYQSAFFLGQDADKYAYFRGSETTPVNQPHLERDAVKRTDKYVGAMRARKTGIGYAGGLSAHGVTPGGLIDSVTYRWSPPAEIDMVISVGAGDVERAEAERRKARNAADVARRRDAGVVKP